MENTVETNVTETAVDDALQESMVEEQDASEPIEAALQESVAEPAAEESEAQTEEAAPKTEPGWIRKRIDKAVSKAVAEAEQRVSAEYEKRFAPMMQRMLESEAQELVRQGEFKSLERAKEYLQLKQGVTVTPPKQNRDEQGRFASAQQDESVSARADMLAKQAEKLKAKRGLDVMAEFNSNDEIRQKVVTGEWDFYDVADEMAEAQQRRKSTPAPMRSPNGASGSEKSSIATMTDEQFKRLERNISGGKRYSV